MDRSYIISFTTKSYRTIAVQFLPKLDFSDHRPVYATFKITVKIINHTIKKNLSDEIYKNYKDSHNGIFDILVKSFDNKELNEGKDASLPPPSSDKQKWWLEGVKLQKLQSQVLKMIIWL